MIMSYSSFGHLPNQLPFQFLQLTSRSNMNFTAVWLLTWMPMIPILAWSKYYSGFHCLWKNTAQKPNTRSISCFQTYEREEIEDEAMWVNTMKTFLCICKCFIRIFCALHTYISGFL